MIGTTELIVIGVVALLLLFGIPKLPEIGKGVGEAIKNFKKAISSPTEIDVTPKKKTEEEKEKEEEKKA